MELEKFDELFEQTENTAGYAANVLIERAKIAKVEKEGKITLTERK